MNTWPDSLDRKVKIVGRMDKIVILELFNEDETKECIVVFFFFKIGDQNVRG